MKCSSCLVPYLNSTGKNIFALALGCLFVVAAFGGAEALLRFKVWVTTAPGEGAIHSRFNNIVEPHPQLTYHAKPSSSITDNLVRGGEVIYSCTYNIDSKSNRITPFNNSPERRCTALFLGCSFTFGTGVEDSETLPTQFANAATTYHPVNAGFNGYGLQQTWLQLRDEQFLNSLPFDKGVAIYTFIDHHVSRLVGTPAVLNDWKYALPWLVDHDGQIEHRGTFVARDPLQFFINRYCRRLHLFRFLENRIRKPAQAEPANSIMLDFTAQVIVNAAQNLAQLQPDYQLWVMIFPDSLLGDELCRRLKNTSVKCLNYSRLLDENDTPKESFFYKDNGAGAWGHPKATTYTLVAQQLAKDIPPCE